MPKTGTVLVTGSSGYLGYAVAKRLSGAFDVVGFDRRMPAHPPPTAECLYTDVTSETSLRRAMEALRDLHGRRLGSVIHLAAYYDFSGAPSPLYEKVTVEGTRRVLRLLRDLFDVEQFIFASTMLVHAPTTPGHPITEEWPLRPTWAYPASKVRTEQVIRAERGDIPAAIVRLAGVYDDLGHTATLPRQIQRIYERDLTAYLFPGDPSHGQALIHLEDMLALFDRLVERRGDLPSDVTLLAGEEETLAYGELQAVLGRLIHSEEWKTRRIAKPLAKIGAWLQDRLPLGRKPFIKPWMIDVADDHYELDLARARDLLDWQPQRRLRDSIPRIVAALKADPWAWYRENELAMPLWLAEIEPPPAEAEVTAGGLERLSALVHHPHPPQEAAAR